MYADGTSLRLKSKDSSHLNEAINEDLLHLETWLKSKRLSLNVATTQVMLVCTKAKRNVLEKLNQSLQKNNRETELEVVNKANYL